MTYFRNLWATPPVAALALFCLLPGLSGCFAANPVVKLTPMADELVWDRGQAIAWHERAGLRVAIAFAEQRDGRLRLRVEVSNQRQDQVMADPGSILYRYCRVATGGGYSCGQVKPVVDPEGTILATEYKANQASAEHANKTVGNTVVMAVGVVGQASALATGDRDGHAISSEVVANARGGFSEDDHRYSVVSGELAETRRSWMHESFRRTTLAPGHSAAGFVELPVSGTANRLFVRIAVAEQTFDFRFRQDLYRP